MGEIADMMLEGSMCQQCGEYLGTGDGYPTLCTACSEKELPKPSTSKKKKKRKKV